MTIGAQLKEARQKAGLTQEAVAEALQVSRQTVSNWENQRSYPDVVSVIHLSDLYGVSLDALLKGDQGMLKHVEETTDLVASNRKLLTAILGSLAVFAGLIGLAYFLPRRQVYLAVIICLILGNTVFLLSQIIKRI